MSERNEQIRMDRALEFLAYSHAEIQIWPSGEPNRRHVFLVEDVKQGHLCARLRRRPPGADSANREWQGFASFHNQALSFLLEALPRPVQCTDAELFFFKIPEHGVLTDHRETTRIQLDDQEHYRAEIEVDTFLGRRRFVTERLVDLSKNAIGLYLERERGLCLPDDQVRSLTITKNDQLVLENSGVIARIDAERPSPEGQYFTVIRLNAGTGQNVQQAPSVSRRIISRLTLSESYPGYAQCTHPFFDGLEIKARIFDISTSGICLIPEEIDRPILPGMILRRVSLQFPHISAVEVDVRVSSIHRLPAEHGEEVRIGGEFTGASSKLIKLISQVAQKITTSQLSDLGPGDYEDLLEFFFETGFIYHDKRKLLQNSSANLSRTYQRILKANNPIMKNIAFREKRKILGHINSIKFFDHTWLIQHLNALKGANNASAAQAVLKGITDFFTDAKANAHAEIQYVTCYYRPDNIYPTMMFGEARDHIQDSRICDFSDFDYCLLKSDARDRELPPPPADIDVRESGARDHEQLERVLISQGKGMLIRLEDLFREKMAHLDVTSEYQSLGLYRHRRVFVAAAVSGEQQAFAICNYASPGLNLSELTNSFRIVYSHPDSSLNSELGNALAAKALASYRETEMPYPVLFLDPSQPLPEWYQRAKVYRYWYLSAQHVRLFRDSLQRVQANMKALLGKYSTVSSYEKATSGS